MNAISSLKPNCHESVSENQRLARLSWDRVFSHVIYVNDEEPVRIKSMVERCASFTGWSCLINADIIVDPMFVEVEKQLNQANALCAISQRYELPGEKLVDLGLDFFSATQSVWQFVAQEIPDKFVIGRILWDTWLMNFMGENFNHAFYDITPAKVIFHPRHGNRGDQSMHIEPDRYLTHNHWPSKRIYIE